MILIYQERSKAHFQCIKSFIKVVETSNKNQFFYFYVLNLFKKLSNLTMMLFDGLVLGKYQRYGRENSTQS